LVAQIDPAKPVRQRSAAAQALAGSTLNAAQLASLTGTLRSAGPLELPILLRAYEKGGDEALGGRLMDSLEGAKGLANLRADIIETALAKFPEGIQKRGQTLLASLDVDRGQQQARLEELASNLQGGDVRRGQAIFNSSKAACLACHRIGYLGGRIGPDLTRIGEIRDERDLLEAVVYPSASFVRSYEPVVVTTASDTYNGVPIEETDDYILLATGTDTQARIERPLIEEVRPGTVSIMPAGLEEEFTQAELADLIAFLKNTKRGPN
jgi:putative heme-binding domain-containing protein